MNRRVPFGDDLEFLFGHTQVVVLSDPSGRGKVAVSPSLQGRVLTSSLAGESGTSFGWINRPLLESGEPQPHRHAYGGEDRFWVCSRRRRGPRWCFPTGKATAGSLVRW